MKLTANETIASGGITVEIEGIGSVLITATDEGIVADIFAGDDTDDSIASTWATHHELNPISKDN